MVGTYHNQLINEKLYDNSRSRHNRNPGQLSQREKRKRTLDVDNDPDLLQADAVPHRNHMKYSRNSRSPHRESDNDFDYRDY